MGYVFFSIAMILGLSTVFVKNNSLRIVFVIIPVVGMFYYYFSPSDVQESLDSIFESIKYIREGD